MFKAKTNKLKKLKKILSPAMYAKIVRATLNDQAFEARRVAQQQILPRTFTLRNKFIVNSVRIKKSPKRKLARLVALMGSINPALRKQEKGATINEPRIPATFSRISKSPEKKVRAAMRVNKLGDLPKPSDMRGNSLHSKNVALLRRMSRTKDKRAFIIRGHRKIRKGIYKLHGGGKNPRLRIIHDLSKKRVRLKRRRWLLPSARPIRKLYFPLFQKNFRRLMNVK